MVFTQSNLASNLSNIKMQKLFPEVTQVKLIKTDYKFIDQKF